MTATDPTELLTVPQAATRLGVAVDWLRKALRKTPAAQALFAVIGPTRAIPVGKLDELRRLVEQD
jgi:hypothetical protein